MERFTEAEGQTTGNTLAFIIGDIHLTILIKRTVTVIAHIVETSQEGNLLEREFLLLNKPVVIDKGIYSPYILERIMCIAFIQSLNLKMPVIPFIIGTDIVHINVYIFRTDTLRTQRQVIIFPRHQLQLGRITQNTVPFFLGRQSRTAEQSSLKDKRKTFIHGIA